VKCAGRDGVLLGVHDKVHFLGWTWIAIEITLEIFVWKFV